MLRRMRREDVVRRATSKTKVAITGAFTYSGRYITKLLLEDPNVTEIRNLTNHPNRSFETNPESVTCFPLKFTPGDFPALVDSLRSVDVFICTYWMRYFELPDGHANPAVERIKTLVDACKQAGVKRMVYVSHTQANPEDFDFSKSNGNPDDKSNRPPYIEAKAEAERYVAEHMPSYGFVRPCVLFGESPEESIVVNNMAYVMRRVPAMLFVGNPKELHFHPVHVKDLAEMCVNMAFPKTEDEKMPAFIDAVGPEKLTFYEFASLVRSHSQARFCFFPPLPFTLPPSLLYTLMKPVNTYWLNDLFVDQGDLEILANGLACSKLSASEEEGGTYWGKRKFSEWLKEQGPGLGETYINSFKRYYDVQGMSALLK